MSKWKTKQNKNSNRGVQHDAHQPEGDRTMKQHESTLSELEPLIATQPDAAALRKRLPVFLKQAAKYARLEGPGRKVPSAMTWGNIDLMLFLGMVDGVPKGTRLSDMNARAESTLTQSKAGV